MIQISLIELSLIPKYGGRQVLSDLRWKIVQNRSEISIYNVTIVCLKYKMDLVHSKKFKVTCDPDLVSFLLPH